MEDRIKLTEDRFYFNEDTGKLEITIKDNEDYYKPNLWKNQILSDYETVERLKELVNTYPLKGIMNTENIYDVIDYKDAFECVRGVISILAPKVLEKGEKE